MDVSLADVLWRAFFGRSWVDVFLFCGRFAFGGRFMADGSLADASIADVSLADVFWRTILCVRVLADVSLADFFWRTLVWRTLVWRTFFGGR